MIQYLPLNGGEGGGTGCGVPRRLIYLYDLKEETRILGEGCF